LEVLENATSEKSGKVLWVQGRWRSSPNFIPALIKRNIQVSEVSTGKDAQQRVSEEYFDILVVDAASMRTTGKRICKSIRDEDENLPIILICENESKINKEAIGVTQILQLPFTIRKLNNRIEPYLPLDQDRAKKIGDISYNFYNNQVITNGKTTVLTPRLMRLFKLFLDNRGSVLDRENLFKTVWRTDYTGDTRTLDVHISWLRQAIEKNPKKPVLLKTIRGVGYRLDI
jgi:DNA-binding response OmpR family regulator